MQEIVRLGLHHWKLGLLQSVVLLAGWYWAGQARALTWSDNYLGYRYGSAYAEPAIVPSISKHIVSYTHASGYQYGSNYLSVDVLMSDRNDPAASGTQGATEVYGVYRHNLSLSAVSGKSFSREGLRDVALTVGGDWGDKNDAFAARTRKLRVGPTLSLDVPGFLDVGVYWQKEWNHNGIVNQDVSFTPAPVLGAAWGIKFGATSLPLEFKGFLDYSAAKGKDGFGLDTRNELLLRMFLMADVSGWFGSSNRLWVGPGYEYWHNKFGNQPGVGTRASTPMFNVEFHL